VFSFIQSVICKWGTEKMLVIVLHTVLVYIRSSIEIMIWL